MSTLLASPVYTESITPISDRNVNVKTISSFELFKENEIKMLAQAIKNDKFYFVVEPPSEAVRPRDIFPFQMTNDHYARVLDDPMGHFECFLLCFIGENGQLLRYPMGIYGVSPGNKIRFPVLLGGIILNFLRISEEVFIGYVYKRKPSEKNKNIKWGRLYSVKKHLIKRVLLFYTQMEDDYSSAMAWKSRGKNSITRQAGEALPDYVRIEHASTGVEYYHRKDLTPELIQYLMESFERFDPSDEIKKPLVEHQLSDQFKLLLSIFIKELVNTSASFK